MGALKRHRGRVIARLAGGLALIAILASVVVVPVALGQDQAVIIRTLRSARDFRVRVQAAFALGNAGDQTARSHLEAALRESNPAVRAAAATALGRLGDQRAARALRRARRDSSAAVRMQAERSLERLRESDTPDQPSAAPRVRSAGGGSYPSAVTIPSADRIPWGRIRYVVVMGDVANRSDFRGAEPLLTDFRTQMHRNLRLLRGVAVFDSSSEMPSDARRQIARRHLPTLRLDGNLVDVDRRRQGREFSVRCAVSLVLLTEPGRDLRGMLSGAATGSEAPRRDRAEQERRLAQQALTAAIRSAMSSAPSALQRAANH